MAHQTIRKSSKNTPLRDVGGKKPAQKPVGAHARRIKAPDPKVEQPPTDRDAKGTRHGKGANRRPG